MNKTLILVHGRSIKPPRKVMERLWVRALAHGIGRDYPELQAAFSAARKEFVYYGDLSRCCIGSTTCGLIRRARSRMRSACQELMARPREAFLAECRNSSWRVPGALREFLQINLGNMLSMLHMLGPLVEAAFPDVRAYWRHQQSYYGTIHSRLAERLQRAAAGKDSVCLVAHSGHGYKSVAGKFGTGSA